MQANLQNLQTDILDNTGKAGHFPRAVYNAFNAVLLN